MLLQRQEPAYLRADRVSLKGWIDRMSLTDDRPPSGSATQDNFIPLWLLVLVLVLLLAVVGVGGYVIRGVLAGDRPAATREQLEVTTWLKQSKAKPDDLGVHLGLGAAYQQAGQYGKALAEYRLVLKSRPRDTAALYDQGIAYRSLSQDDKARESWLEVLKVDKTHALAARALGNYYADQHDYRRVVEVVLPAVQAHPEMADLHYLLARAYEKQGASELAIARYRLALSYAPDLTGARAGLKRLGVTK